MLKHYPYRGWLIIAIILWGIAGYRFYSHRQARLPERMAHIVTDDLRIREKELDKLLDNKRLLPKIFADSLNQDEENLLMKLPVYIYAYNKDTLVYWNNNFVIGGYNAKDMPDSLLRNERGTFLEKHYKFSFIDSQKKLTVLIPIVTQYPIQNEYLRSHFEAADYIPVSTQVLSKDAPGSLAIKYKDGTPAYYLKFNKQDMQLVVPDAFLISVLIMAILASIFWVQLIAIYLSRTRSTLNGLILTLVVVIGGRAATYVFGLPFKIQDLTLFSPRLYASSAILPSLGDLLINALCLLWITVFIVRHTAYKGTLAQITSVNAKRIWSGLLALGLMGYTFGFVYIIRTLVIDSNISFDVAHFYSINIYTIVGLLTIGIITIVSCVIIYLLYVLLSNVSNKSWSRYGLVALAGCLFILVTGPDNRGFATFLVIWLLLFIVLLDIKQLRLVSDLFAPHMLFWASFICAFSTAVLQYFNHVRDGEARKVFATQGAAPDRDDVTELAFDKVARNIEKDKAIRNLLQHPVVQNRRIVAERFDMLLGGQLNKYQSKVYLFDRFGHGLFNKDTASYNTLSQEIEESTNTYSSSLFYREYILEGHHYVAYIPITNDSTQKNIGYVFIDLSLKQATNEAVYPELLQSAGIKNNPTAEYPYAVYINNHLVTQTHDYPFPVYINPDTSSQQQFTFYDRNDASELWYKVNDRKTVIVVHKHSLLIEAVTTFSYLFGVQIMIAVLLLLYHLYLSYFIKDETGKLFTLTLRRRVHFSMLGIVMASFFIIGVVTILYFKWEYKASSEAKLQTAVQVAQQSVQQYLIQEHGLDNAQRFDSITRSNKFKYRIADLAAQQKIDINVYNNNGVLNVTSQDDIFDKGLLSRIIRSDAYYQLIYEGKSIVTQDERIGKLFYLSSYVPLRDEEGNALGYLNVPFFSSEKDLNYQISSIVVTLINLYAFIFLLSSVFTVFITRWITRSLNIIISQFSRLNLRRNELLEWRYDDEIGMLVQEYNKMVKKVEENAALLAQSERETAWREMARQVAHEIKNPLTPMKLNIQYLQQALREGNPNARELAVKVSASLIEQIENLSYIASEFSNFAKMPEAKPEAIDLIALLDKSLELYKNDTRVNVDMKTQEQELNVFADRSQLMRVFTNLLENAKQAIPENKIGNIQVSVKLQDNNGLVSISDNGTGIAADVIERIFQPYFTTKSSGTGLGLAMTRKIIEFWNGHIWFETEEGKGTTFFIQLPLMKE